MAIAILLGFLLMTFSTHWDILSSWSKAGVGTSIVLELKPSPDKTFNKLTSVGVKSSRNEDTSIQNNNAAASTQNVVIECNIVSKEDSKKVAKKSARPRVVFDMGATPCFDDAIPAKYVFVSHGHIDHIGAIFSHARAHAVGCGGAAPTYFVPASLVPLLEQARDAMSLLDATNFHPEKPGRKESLIKMNLVAVHPGDEFPLKGIKSGSKTSFFMRAFEVDHAGHPALGYLIGSRVSSGLKPEYQHLDGSSLRDLVKSGVIIKADPVEKIEVAYTGDTCTNGLKTGLEDPKLGVENPLRETRQKSLEYLRQLFQAELILCELTFLDANEKEQTKEMAKERGHLHICDIAQIFGACEDTAYINANDKDVAGTTVTLDNHGRPSSLPSYTASQVGCSADSNSDAPGVVSNDNLVKQKTDEYESTIVFFHLSGRHSPASHALDLITDGLPPKLLARSYVMIVSMLSNEEKMAMETHSSMEMQEDEMWFRRVKDNGCISVADYMHWRNR